MPATCTRPSPSPNSNPTKGEFARQAYEAVLRALVDPMGIKPYPAVLPGIHGATVATHWLVSRCFSRVLHWATNFDETSQMSPSTMLRASVVKVETSKDLLKWDSVMLIEMMKIMANIVTLAGRSANTTAKFTAAKCPFLQHAPLGSSGEATGGAMVSSVPRGHVARGRSHNRDPLTYNANSPSHIMTPSHRMTPLTLTYHVDCPLPYIILTEH